jgi:hypothetical protein
MWALYPLRIAFLSGYNSRESGTEAASVWRRRSAKLPELQQDHVANETEPACQLRSPIRATNLCLLGLRSPDRAHRGRRREIVPFSLHCKRPAVIEGIDCRPQ